MVWNKKKYIQFCCQKRLGDWFKLLKSSLFAAMMSRKTSQKDVNLKVKDLQQQKNTPAFTPKEQEYEITQGKTMLLYVFTLVFGLL